MAIFTYENGMKAICNERIDSQVSAIVVQVNGGSGTEKNNLSGISEYVSRLLLTGTKNYPTVEALSNYAKLNGIILKTQAESEGIVLSALCPSETLNFAVELLSDIVFNYDFDKLISEKVKNEMLIDIERLQENHAYNLEKSVNQNLFYRTGLANPKYGSSITAARFNNEVAEEYWKRIVTPKNTVISVTGNFETDEMYETIKEFFADKLPEDGEYHKIKFTSEVEEYAGSLRTRNKRLNQSRIAIAFPTYSYKNPKKYLPMVLEPIILKKIRKSLKISSPYFNIVDLKTTNYSNNGKIVFEIAVDNEYVESYLKNFVRAIKELTMEEAVGDQEFELEKNIYITNFMHKCEDVLEQSYISARELALCKRSFNNSSEKLKIEMLTSKDANKYIVETFDLRKMFVSYLGHPISLSYEDLVK